MPVKQNGDLYKKIRRIQIQTTQLAEDILAGAYRSAFKGRGMEFEEVREYEPGDDVRTIDWNVTARSDRAFVKSYREERDLTVMLLVDVSASTRYGSVDQFKSDLIAEISAVLAFSAIKNNDKIGLILFSSDVEKYIPPNKGTRHVLRLIREVLAFQPKNKGTDLEAVFRFLGKVQRTSAVCFLLTDFICPENYDHELALTARRHDLIALDLVDAHERSFPSYGLINLTSLETGESFLVNSSSALFQEQFINNTKVRQSQYRTLLLKNGVGYVEISTDQDYMPALRKFFKVRARKRR
jgi:uncharacterized protein (DUF58 family)